MKRFLAILSSVFLLLGLAATPYGWAQDLPWQEPGTGASLFTAEELEDLLAPIALYPDPLLAQILPAATFVDQIDEAARFVRMYGVTSEIDLQGWDVSVKAVAHYPEVLFMMDQRLDWTTSLGQAFVNQETQVMNTIQRLRAEALAHGNLVSSAQQQVIVDGGIIRIVPAAPDIIYVPEYDPQVVYLESPPPSSLLVFFGTGFIIGAWLNRDCDWHRHRIYYHGWEGGGWIGRARPHIRVRHDVYINSSDRDIRINRRVMQRNTLHYRQEIRNNVRFRRERTERYRQRLQILEESLHLHRSTRRPRPGENLYHHPDRREQSLDQQQQRIVARVVAEHSVLQIQQPPHHRQIMEEVLDQGVQIRRFRDRRRIRGRHMIRERREQVDHKTQRPQRIRRISRSCRVHRRRKPVRRQRPELRLRLILQHRPQITRRVHTLRQIVGVESADRQRHEATSIIRATNRSTWPPVM